MGPHWPCNEQSNFFHSPHSVNGLHYVLALHAGNYLVLQQPEESWGMEVDARLDAFHGHPLGQTYNNMRSPNARKPTVLLTTLQYDDNSTTTKSFEYSCPLWFMLYDSPPAVHPQESLVVWPLGGGNLLFVDVAAKTYFTRKLRLSASHSG